LNPEIRKVKSQVSVVKGSIMISQPKNDKGTGPGVQAMAAEVAHFAQPRAWSSEAVSVKPDQGMKLLNRL
jgi:hypothetical protein